MSNICDDLRAAILQAAMQGKLTEQLPEDGNAKELYAAIRSNKEELIAKGVIKKEKIQQTIGELNLPNSWVSTMLGKVVTEFLVPQRDKPKKFGGNIPWCRIEDIEGKYLNGSKSGKYVDDATVSDMNLKINPVGTVICSCSASMGVQAITTIECCTNQTFMGLVCPDGVYNEFVYYYLKSLGKDFFSRIGAGTTIKYISQDKIASIAFPLPPLAEQRRIVSRIEQLMARVADLEQSADALASLKKAFPDDIKASLLQAAMQGKLTEQLPEDGDAEELLDQIKAEKEKLIAQGNIKKQKPLTPITNDEIPFIIPKNWSLCRVGDLFEIINGAAFKPSDWSNSGTKIVRIQNLNNPNASFNLTKKDVDESIRLRGGELLFAWSGTPGTSFGAHIWNGGEAVLNQHIFLLKFNEDCFDIGYLRSALNNTLSGLISKAHGSAGLQHVTRPMFEKTILPIPPLAEQKRIVKRLDVLTQNINEVGELIASE